MDSIHGRTPNSLQFDRYYRYEEMTVSLNALVAAFPLLLTIESIGKSYEGRDVWCVTVTNSATGPAADKPAFWCDGNIHATEVSASSACLYLIHRLATQYGHDEEITRSLDTRAFYIVPRVNPDGAELYFDANPRYIRSSVRPYPYEEEPIDGLRAQDIDGDGRILNMRIPDDNGPWKQHPDEPRLMVKRDPVELGGKYYRVVPEGLLENWDGLTLKLQKPKEGLDLNRNFPAHWRQEGEQQGAGPFPGSEPEVHNLIRFITSHTNITGGITFHTFSGVLLRPYGAEADDTMPAEDLWTYKTIGKRGSEITGYPAISVYHDFRYHPKEVITGVFDDWMYDHLGLYAWTCEIWSPQRQAGLSHGFDVNTKSGEFRFIDWYREHPVEDDLKMLAWADTALDGAGYVAWKPFEHPQLGRVEIGGWDAQVAFRNPPGRYLEKEIAPLADWAIWHALISPKLEIAMASIEALSDHTSLVRLAIDNTGWLPTYVSKRALERKAVRAVVVEIEPGEGVELVTGKLRQEVGQLEGRAYKPDSPYGWSSDPTDYRTVVEWVVKGPSESVVSLTARHERAGVVRSELTLP